MELEGSIDVFVDLVINLSTIRGTASYSGWVASSWQLWRKKDIPGSTRRTLALLGAFGLIVFLFVALNSRLFLISRYYLAFAWSMTMIAAYWLATLWEQRDRHRLAAVLLAGALEIRFLGTDAGKHQLPLR